MLQEQIDKDYIAAMKQKDCVRSSTLSFLRAQLKNVMIDQQAEKLDDAQVTGVIKKQIKQRQDSIGQYEKGNRPELAEKERQEMNILKSYLPAEIPDDELGAIIQETVNETGAKGIKEMGLVMKAVMPKLGGRADNQKVSQLVKEVLTKL